jgi:hypothetical protein
LQSDLATEKTQSTTLYLHLLTIAMALLAGIIFTLVEHNEEGHRHSTWCTIEIVVQSLVVLIGTWFARRKLMGANAVIIPPLLVMTIVLSLLCEPIQRTWFGTGHPLEVLVMHCQSNLMLAIATCSFRRSYRQLCAILSLFLVIFCLTKSTGPAILVLFVVYSLIGIVWLIASHWEDVSRRVISGNKRRLPISWLIGIPTLVVVALLYSTRDGKASTDRIDGFMNSSGGSHDHDDHAHGGVNDGDGLVAGEDNIQSFGPIEDAPFADDDKPSLYDAFDDTFDEPVKIKKTERAIAIPPDSVKEIEDRIAKSRQAGREFSTLRRKDEQETSPIKDLDSSALFYVAGRTPVHLRSQTWDIFDGVDWFPSEPERILDDMQIGSDGERHWLRVEAWRDMSHLFASRETHGVKIVNLKGNVIPSPPQADAISIDLVNRLDMYEAWEDGLIGLDRENLPEMTAIQVASNRIDSGQLSTGFDVLWVPRGRTVPTSMPRHADTTRIQALAAEWTSGLERGPAAIEAIVSNLRTNYTLDRDAHASPNIYNALLELNSVETDPIEESLRVEEAQLAPGEEEMTVPVLPVTEFLFESRRGPEYMFATAAACLLRSQGYPTRLVTGFYARPEKYQRKKRHTPVHVSDVHAWCEVEIGGNRWITVEPSPGYEILQPPPGLMARLTAWIVDCVELIRTHLWLSLAAFAAMVFVFLRRRHIADLIRQGVWAVTSPSGNGDFVLGALGLIERRLRSAGVNRPVGTTFRNWVSSLDPLPPNREQLLQFASIANHAAFGAHEVNADDRRFCEGLVRELSFGRIREIRRKQNQKAKA